MWPATGHKNLTPKIHDRVLYGHTSSFSGHHIRFRCVSSPTTRLDKQFFISNDFYEFGLIISLGEYIHGNREMGLIPVTMSMMVTFISTLTILGYPTEVVVYGPQYWIGGFGLVLGVLLATWVFVPIFYPLKLTSVNEVGTLSSISIRGICRPKRFILLGVSPLYG